MGISLAYSINLTYPIIWLIIIGVLLLIEIVTMGITTIWFAFGAICAFIASLIFDNLAVEVIVFFVVSIVLLYFTRPIVTKYLNPKRERTNYDRVIGQQAHVIATINNAEETGKVLVAGQEWTARSTDNEVIIDEGTEVRIEEIVGVKLIVTPIK